MDLGFCAVAFLNPWCTVLSEPILVQEQAPVHRFALVFGAILVLAFSTSGQQQKPDSAAAQKTSSTPPFGRDCKGSNPVKSCPESHGIKNGHNHMPAEGPRITTEQGSDLVNYTRSFARSKEGDTKQESEAKPR
jgi:hypothetical protein